MSIVYRRIDRNPFGSGITSGLVMFSELCAQVGRGPYEWLTVERSPSRCSENIVGRGKQEHRLARTHVAPL